MSLRKEILSQKKRLSEEEVLHESQLIQKKLISHFQKISFEGKTFALYRPLSREVQIKDFEEELQKKRARLCYPRVTDSLQGKMEMIECEPSSRWKKGEFGIEEPVGDQVVSPERLDFILVPGIAFTLDGKRMGRGKGFYDRYLSLAKKAVKIGVCFDFQLVENLKAQEWDIPMDAVVSGTQQWSNDRI